LIALTAVVPFAAPAPQIVPPGGDAPAVVPAVTPPRPSLQASIRVVGRRTRRQRIRVSGRVAGIAPAPRVRLQRRTPGGRWRSVARLMTRSTGAGAAFSRVLRVRRPVRLRVVAIGDDARLVGRSRRFARLQSS
jgi:hypothetical protein